MIQNNVFNFCKIRPFFGKYAVKGEDFFDIIEEYQGSLPKEWFFKPLRAEIEITSRCNQKCPNCGMRNLKDINPLTDKEIIKFVEEMSQNKIPSIAITGGEPFFEFDTLLQLIKISKENGIDISKITTNAFWGKDLENIDNIFKKLKQVGLFENKYFVPLIMISIGEQTVPFENISNIIHYMSKNFRNQDIHIGISSLKTNGIHKTNLLKDNYEKLYGVFPEEKIYITYANYVNSGNNQTQKQFKLLDLVESCYMCFDKCVGSYVLPTILVKKDGTVYACSCFNVPKKYFAIGNIYKEQMKDILERANKNTNIKLIKEHGIRGVLEKVDLKDKKILENIYVDSYCEACQILLDKINN